MRTTLVLSVVTACAIPEQKVDPFACATDPPPASAPATIAITGSAHDPVTGLSVASPTVAFQPMGFTATGAASGQFSGSLMTAGMALNGDLKATAAGYLDAYFYPAVPFFGDYAATIEMVTPGDLEEVGSGAGVMLGSDTQVLFIGVVDCNEDPVGGATVGTSSGTVLYLDGNDHPDPSAAATDPTHGAAIIVGITGSDVAISAGFSDIPFHPHSVPVQPGTLPQTEIRPGS